MCTFKAPVNLRRVNYGALFTDKIALLKKAFSSFAGGKEFDEFTANGEYFDFAVFMALKTNRRPRPRRARYCLGAELPSICRNRGNGLF